MNAIIVVSIAIRLVAVCWSIITGYPELYAIRVVLYGGIIVANSIALAPAADI